MPYESAEDPVGLPLDPLGRWDRESESRMNSWNFLGQFVLFFAAKYSRTFLHQSKPQDFKTF